MQTNEGQERTNEEQERTLEEQGRTNEEQERTNEEQEQTNERLKRFRFRGDWSDTGPRARPRGERDLDSQGKFEL